MRRQTAESKANFTGRTRSLPTVHRPNRRFPTKAPTLSTVPRQRMPNKVPIARMSLRSMSAYESTRQIRADYDRIVFLADGLVSFIQTWQPSEGAVPMTSLTRKQGGRRRWRWLTVGRAQAIIAVVCLYLGVFV